LWLKIDHIPPVDTDTCEFIDWHLRMGHRANAVHALMIGTRQVGFIGLVFDHDQPLTEPQLELAHALCQPITLALELARLSRLAQRSSEQSAMLKERNRLAREIHDGIAQSFLAIQMQLDLVGGPVSDSPEVRKALSLARHGLTEARQAVAALRPPGLQNNELPAAIQRLLNDADRANPVDCVLVSPPEWETLPTEVEDHLFRIVQEAVNNALRHSQASRLKVELSQATGEASVLVADDGCGFDMSSEMASRGFGLESMQQRAQLIGARIDWLTQPGKGTQVLVSWTAPAATNASAPVAIKASR
jgi:signal transduction histidine kinase